MTTHSETGVLTGRRLNTAVAFLFGAVFVLVGLSGFFVSGGHHVIGQEGGKLLGLFQVNAVHNIVHLSVGAVLIAAAAMGNHMARRANTLFGLVYLVVFVFGLFAIGNAANILALNGADNWLHLVLGLVLTGVGLGADRSR